MDLALALPVFDKAGITSEVAYRFEFKMLCGCPALETLTFDIHSTTRGEFSRLWCIRMTAIVSDNILLH